MSDYIKVEGATHLYRDESSQAIVSTDIEQWRLAKRRKEIFKNQINEINTLKEEMGEIKSLLTELMGKLSG